MSVIRVVSFFAGAGLCLAAAAAGAGDREDLHRLLDEFLWGASIGDAEVHEAFWGDDLVYTSSRGTRTSKAEIVAGMRAAPPVDIQ